MIRRFRNRENSPILWVEFFHSSAQTGLLIVGIIEPSARRYHSSFFIGSQIGGPPTVGRVAGNDIFAKTHQIKISDNVIALNENSLFPVQIKILFAPINSIGKYDKEMIVIEEIHSRAEILVAQKAMEIAFRVIGTNVDGYRFWVID